MADSPTAWGAVSVEDDPQKWGAVAAGSTETNDSSPGEAQGPSNVLRNVSRNTAGDVILGPSAEDMEVPAFRLPEQRKKAVGQGLISALGPGAAIFAQTQTGQEIAAGIGEKVASVIEGLTSPAGLASLPMMTRPEAWLPMGAQQVKESAEELAAANTLKEKASASAGLLLGGGMLVPLFLPNSLAEVMKTPKARPEVPELVKPVEPPTPAVSESASEVPTAPPGASVPEPEPSTEGVPNASSISSPATVGRDVSSQSVENPGQVPVEEGRGGVQPQAQPGVPEPQSPGELSTQPGAQETALRDVTAREKAQADLEEELRQEGWTVTRRPKRTTITPAEDTLIGKNDAGESVYQRADGSVYRMRFDRKDRPNGYPDFGGDLNPVSPPGIAPGPGAASPSEFAPKEFNTSIKNAQVDRERAARGQEPLMASARQSNPASWDKAMTLIDENPGAQDALISSLNEGKTVPEIEPVVQEALLLHRRIDLRNELEKSARTLTDAVDTKNDALVDQQRLIHARLEDMMDELESATKKSGTEIGRALQFRREFASQDFSLAGMIAEARSARGGRHLSTAELAEVTKLHEQLTTLQKEFDDYRAAQSANTGNPNPPLDNPALDKLAKVRRAQKQFKETNEKIEESERPLKERVLDWITKIRRFEVLSGPRSLAKLASYSLQKIVGTPFEESGKAVIAKAPGLASIAEKSPTIGIHLGRELSALKAGFTKGIRDAVQTFRTGSSNLEALYAKDLTVDPEWTNFFGRLHGAEKSPLKRIAFERSLSQRMDWAAKNGIDVTDPVVQLRLGTEAYGDALKEILMNPNVVANRVNRFIRSMEEPELGIKGKVAATAARVLLPIQRVPLNFVARTWEYVGGLETGMVQAGRALAKGVENLKPEEASQIMTNLTRGSIGTAAILTGFFNPDMFGGVYRPGVKPKRGDVKTLGMRVGQTDIPFYLTHNPLIYAAQLGATLRRVADSTLRKSDPETQGLTAGVMAALFGLADETPYVREMRELVKFGEERQAPRVAGQMVRSLTVPLGLQWIAEQMDKDKAFSLSEEPTQRAPRTFREQIKVGIPVVRETVPSKRSGARR